MAYYAFWQKKNSLIGKILSPLGFLYALSVRLRFKRTKPFQVSVPVICVGNLSVGGTGKTPVCIAISKILTKLNQPFFFLNHGYKGKERNVMVSKTHTAVDVGDEALLFASLAPTVVDNKRARGAQLAVKKGAKCIIMDDGFQNPSLIKTLSFVVVDGKQGFGNNRVLPAGPLREPVLRGLQRADAVIIAGEDTAGVEFYLKRNQIDLPVFKGRFVLNEKIIQELRGKDIYAFAGLGQPEKFFDSLTNAGLSVTDKHCFPDHYAYSRFDIEDILAKAGSKAVATTEKDAIKIQKDLLKSVYVVDGQFVFDEEPAVVNFLQGVLNGNDSSI